jgi:inner membrane protein
MASAFSHPAVPLAIAAALGTAQVPPALTVAACAASILPDVDAVGFALGVPYGSPLGHRGFTHSFCFALLVALACVPFASRFGASRVSVLAVVFASAASHGFLDAMTTGGLGVALLAPFSRERFFLPWRVIRVSPIGVASFFSGRGLRILASELLWIWTPCAVLAASGAGLRRLLSPL